MKCKAVEIEFKKDCELTLSTQKHLDYQHLRRYHKLCISPLTLTVSAGEARVCVCVCVFVRGHVPECTTKALRWHLLVCFLNFSHEDLDVQRQNLGMMNACFKIIL